MKCILDTNVIVAAVRSPKGASAEILRRALLGQIKLLCSVPLFLEYEAVLKRPEHLQAAGISLGDASNLLDALAGAIEAVEIAYLWRPQLRDPADDMVLEAAVNGQASTIITFNQRDFLPQALAFGLTVVKPAQFSKEHDMGTQSNYALRLPISLKSGAEQMARQDGSTLNQFIVSAVAEKLAALKTANYFAQRAAHGDLAQALALLNRDGGQPPALDDEFPSQ